MPPFVASFGLWLLFLQPEAVAALRAFVRLNGRVQQHPPRASACFMIGAEEDDLAMRELRRRQRLLGDDAQVSGFDELFASLREEEERAVAAAEAEAMTAFLSDVESGLDETRPRAAPIRKSSGRRDGMRRNGNAASEWGGAGKSALASNARASRRALPLYANDGAFAIENRTTTPSATPTAVISAQAPPADGRRWGAADGGLETTSVVGQLQVLMPTKVMVFIDGTWLYYQLFGRGRRCEISRRYGERWWESHHIDYSRLPQLISDHLSQELARTQPYAQRAVEVVRVLVFSSFRPDDEDVVSQRERMFRAMQELHFEVHLGEFTGGQEKCVDIALAVDMMHYATVPNAFDIAVLVSGDRDFIPALVRTRQKGKRVAVCSMRNSASTDYEDPEANIKDFGVLWLDDHLDDLVARIHPSLLNQRPAMARYLRSVVLEYVANAPGGEATFDELGTYLSQIALGESTSANTYIVHEFGGLQPFVGLFEDDLLIAWGGEGRTAQMIIRAAATAPDESALSEIMATDDEAADQPPSFEPRSLADGAKMPTLDGALDAGKEAGDAMEGAAAAEAAEPSRAGQKSSSDAFESAKSGRSDGALIVDGSLIELLEADAFASRTDGDTLTMADLAHLTVPRLKVELRARGRPAVGTKPTLLRSLLEAIREEEEERGEKGEGRPL